MSEHTKGEWEIMPYTRRDADNIRWVKSVRGKRHITICQTFKPNAEANARLIAAAHALLAACKRDAALANIAIAATPSGPHRVRLTEINILRLQAIAEAETK